MFSQKPWLPHPVALTLHSSMSAERGGEGSKFSYLFFYTVSVVEVVPQLGPVDRQNSRGLHPLSCSGTSLGFWSKSLIGAIYYEYEHPDSSS